MAQKDITMFDYTPSEKNGLALMTYALQGNFDDYNLRGSNLKKIASDFLTNYRDIAQVKRWTLHVGTLTYVMGEIDKTATFRGVNIYDLLMAVKQDMLAYIRKIEGRNSGKIYKSSATA
jgi:hypothetical protein